MKRIVGIVSLLCLVLTMTSCAKDKPLTQTALLGDDVCVISLYDNKTNSTLNGVMDDLQTVATSWMQGVQAVNEAGGAVTAVDASLLRVLQTAQEYTIKTGGAFDITAGALVAMWNTAKDKSALPLESELNSAWFTVGGHRYTVADDGVTLQEGTVLDLSGILGGALADQTAAFVKARGCTSALVEIGAALSVVGTMPDGEPFWIEIPDPADPNKLIGTIAVSDCAVATVDSDRDRYEIDGEWYSPIVDPRTGYPVDSDLVSATIIAPRATDAHALATACLIMGYEKALATLALYDGVEAVLLKTDGSVMATEGVNRVD